MSDVDDFRAERDALRAQLAEARTQNDGLLAKLGSANAAAAQWHDIAKGNVEYTDKARADLAAREAELERVRRHALDVFTVWLLKKHGLLIDEELLAAAALAPASPTAALDAELLRVAEAVRDATDAALRPCLADVVTETGSFTPSEIVRALDLPTIIAQARGSR